MPKGTQPAPRQSQLWTQAVCGSEFMPRASPLRCLGRPHCELHIQGDATGQRKPRTTRPPEKEGLPQAGSEAQEACQAEQEDRGPRRGSGVQKGSSRAQEAGLLSRAARTPGGGSSSVGVGYLRARVGQSRVCQGRGAS